MSDVIAGSYYIRTPSVVFATQKGFMRYGRVIRQLGLNKNLGYLLTNCLAPLVKNELIHDK